MNLDIHSKYIYKDLLLYAEHCARLCHALGMEVG